MELQRIEMLITRYLDNEASPEERDEVENWYAMIQEDTEFVPDMEISEEEYKKLIQSIVRPQKFKIKRLYQFTGWAAAAIIVLSFLMWPLIKQQIGVGKANKEIFTTADNLLTKNTILTLADGRQINIDSQVIGLLEPDKGLKLEISKDMLSIENAPKNSGLTANVLSTPSRRKYSVVLYDGTRVWLNAGSSIRFPASFEGENARQVEITGEAYFEVAHQNTANGSLRPFIVKAAGQQISVLGTRFNVNAYAGTAMVKTTLFHGSVKVESGNQQFILKPGESAESDSATLRIDTEANLDRAIAWRSNLFIFEQANLKQMLSEFSHWYGVEIVYRAQLPNEPFSGKIPMDLELADVLKIVAQKGIKFRLAGDKLYVEALR
jgi:transmembrane sensor